MAGLSICCINSQNYLGHGKRYVEILFDGVRRNLPTSTEFKFICFTDDEEPYAEGIIKRPLPGYFKGWWNKLYLFKAGLFPEGERIVFFDLDTVIVGGLDYIVKYAGPFATLEDFWRPGGLGPAVILWTPSAATQKIWAYFKERWALGIGENYIGIRGGVADQAILEECRHLFKRFDILQNLFPGSFLSYKTDCKFLVPKNTKVVCFHGKPRPHEVTDGWVPQCWKVGGGSILELESVCNVPDATLEKNIRYACDLPLENLADQYLHPKKNDLVIVGGGPSLEETIPEIRLLEENGATIWALNNSYKYLKDNGIYPNAHIMLDAREENIAFVPDDKCLKLYSSQCHPDVFKANGKVIIWHAAIQGIEGLLGTRRVAMVAGGSSVGIKAFGLAQLFGFRDVHLFGYDSSYRGDNNHAYPQPLNEKENVIKVIVNGIEFRCAAWMASQTEDFKSCINGFIEKGMVFHVHGSGLLPYVASLLSH